MVIHKIRLVSIHFIWVPSVRVFEISALLIQLVRYWFRNDYFGRLVLPVFIITCRIFKGHCWLLRLFNCPKSTVFMRMFRVFSIFLASQLEFTARSCLRLRNDKLMIDSIVLNGLTKRCFLWARARRVVSIIVSSNDLFDHLRCLLLLFFFISIRPITYV